MESAETRAKALTDTAPAGIIPAVISRPVDIPRSSGGCLRDAARRSTIPAGRIDFVCYVMGPLAVKDRATATVDQPLTLTRGHGGRPCPHTSQAFSGSCLLWRLYSMILPGEMQAGIVI